jgi:hypothetical protein
MNYDVQYRASMLIITRNSTSKDNSHCLNRKDVKNELHSYMYSDSLLVCVEYMGVDGGNFIIHKM